jgi:hypothetical protein
MVLKLVMLSALALVADAFGGPTIHLEAELKSTQEAANPSSSLAG